MAETKKDKEPSFKWSNIDDIKLLQHGECIKKLGKNQNCYIFIKEHKGYLELMNVFTGIYYKIKEDKFDKDKYKKLSINSLVYRLLALKNPLSRTLSYYPKSELDNIVRSYALQICVNVKERRGDNEQFYNDYPAIVIAAKPKFVTHDVRLANHVYLSSNYPYNPSQLWSDTFKNHLLQKKCKLGEKHPKSTSCDNIIGNCAEQHVVDSLLKDFPRIKIGDIQFSRAIRPRTGEIRPYCENCCRLFKQLKND